MKLPTSRISRKSSCSAYAMTKDKREEGGGESAEQEDTARTPTRLDLVELFSQTEQSNVVHGGGELDLFFSAFDSIFYPTGNIISKLKLLDRLLLNLTFSGLATEVVLTDPFPSLRNISVTLFRQWLR